MRGGGGEPPRAPRRRAPRRGPHASRPARGHLARGLGGRRAGQPHRHVPRVLARRGGSCSARSRSVPEASAGRCCSWPRSSPSSPFEGTVAYAASKAAVAQLARSLANDWSERGVRVNGLAPGVFPTDLNRAMIEGTRRGERILEHTPMARFGEHEELVGAARLPPGRGRGLHHGRGAARGRRLPRPRRAMRDIGLPEIEAYAEAHTTPDPSHLRALAEETRAERRAPRCSRAPWSGGCWRRSSWLTLRARTCSRSAPSAATARSRSPPGSGPRAG